jgi:nicotinamide-nucleotide amidase
MAKAHTPEEATAMIVPLQAQIEERLRGHIFGFDAQTLEGAIHSLLQNEGGTIAVAESCTGGRIAAALTATPGSSKSFLGGVVAYDNAVKVSLLGVNEESLERFGAVSEETAREMANGVRRALGARYAISTTGIAGPDGGSEEKPAGLVWFALDDGAEILTRKFIFPGNREAVQRRATTMALGIIWKALSQAVQANIP